MRIRSFRVQIMLLAVLLSGTVLVASGIVGWLFVYKMGLDRIDQELTAMGLREVSRSRRDRPWERLEGALQNIFGTEEEEGVLVLARERGGKTLHASSHWPEEIPADTFPDPEKIDQVPAHVPPPPDPPPPPEGRRLPGRGSERRPPPPGGRPPPPEPPPPHPTSVSRPAFSTVSSGGERWRIAVLGNPDITLILGISLDDFAEEMRRVRNAFLIALPLALLLIAAGGWLIAQRALRPVNALTRTAEQITARGLDQRIPATKEDAEFMRLITVFNQMMDRLEKSFQQAIRFSADAAHELKTPLTILQGQLEQALQSAPAGSEQQRAYTELLEEVQRLGAITRKLLLLSQADAGQLKLIPDRLNLSEMVDGVCEDMQVLAPNLAVKKDVVPDIWVLADRDLLVQVLLNLTANAIKYNRENGSIEIRLKKDGAEVRFTVSNTGESIHREDRARIFDRFYRVDKSRSRRVDGVGLGLSLAREIARAHKGNLILADDDRDGWVTFTLTLKTEGVRSRHSP